MSEPTGSEGLEQRVDKLEEGQQSILGKLDQLLAGPVTHGADPPAAGPDGRPGDVQTQVRMELERRDRESAAAAEADSAKSEFQQVKDNVSKLLETRPAAPQPRRERMMWGKR